MMILIKLGSRFLFKIERDWAFCERDGEPHYTKVYIGFLHIFLIPERGKFVDYLRMYLNDDYSFHKQVKIAQKRAVSKARAEVSEQHGLEVQRLRDGFQHEYKKRLQAESELRVLTQTITIVKRLENS